MHPVSKEQNEVLEQQRYLLERRMYRLDPAPPKLPMLNKLAQDACQRYGLPEHFVDIKQAAVCGILTALQKYGPSIGTPFAAFQKQYILDGIEDYIRTAQSGVITMTTDTYPVLRRIMAIYHQSGDDCSDDSVQRFCNAGKTKV